jgi:hypothetical protein
MLALPSHREAGESRCGREQRDTGSRLRERDPRRVDVPAGHRAACGRNHPVRVVADAVRVVGPHHVDLVVAEVDPEVGTLGNFSGSSTLSST